MTRQTLQGLTIGDVNNWINFRFYALAAFLPYDLVQLEIRNGVGGPVVDESSSEQTGAEPNLTAANDELWVSPTPEQRRLNIDDPLAKITAVGAFLTTGHHASIKSGDEIEPNPFFPEAPAARRNADGYNYVNERDVQIGLSRAAVQTLWRRALQRALGASRPT
jgi:hypothetical protein